MHNDIQLTMVSPRPRAGWARVSLLLALLGLSACVEEEDAALLDDAYADSEGETLRSAVLLDPIADAMTKENYPNSNFGSTTDLRIRANTNNDKKSLIKFDLSNFSGTIIDAQLRVCGIGTNYAGRSIEVMYVRDDAWTENGVTWNNQPPSNHPSDPRDPGVMPAPGQCTWIPLTAWRVQDEIDGDNILSVKLTRGATNDNVSLSLAARQYVDINMRPLLRLTY